MPSSHRPESEGLATPFGRKLAELLAHRWRCAGCGAEVRGARDLSGGRWRVGARGLEHACSPLHRYWGHVVADSLS
jgi:hypothetical protein